MTTAGPVIYLVDYDIPLKVGAMLRRRFYRALTKICEAYGHNWDRSTMSVFKTEDYDLAMAVYDLASRYGRVNVYRAELLASQV